ncbi:hypothetical protein ABZ297_31055 [Nonomuraea sp. NPDC005983]|uniref:hypothetical protein n=1 Tax=Nonomuraea sp. NPDC005983 TaxID=3155595 RepID=UPI0033A8E9A1
MTGRMGRLAWAVTELFAPQYVALVLPPVAGVLADGWTGLGWGLVAAVLCAGIPAGVIAIGVRKGRLDSKHLVDRSGRKVPLLAGLAAVVVGLALLIALGAPKAVVATAVTMLGWVLVMGSITVWWKISFHAGVSTGATVIIAHLLEWWPGLLIGAVLVSVIGWARVRIAHHTLAQVVTGIAAGGTVAWAAFMMI